MRLSAVLPEDARIAYYATVFFLGMVCLLLTVADGGDAAAGLSGWSAANALVCGTALTVSFHRHREGVAGSLRRSGRGTLL